MTLITQKELGQRLREARKACKMTQEEVAEYIGVSRPTMVQIERGNRGVSGLELSRLAHLFGVSVQSLLGPDAPDADDAVSALFRLNPDIKEDGYAETVRWCLDLGREMKSLEKILGMTGDGDMNLVYNMPEPATKWNAVQQGIRLATEVRRRLELGLAPLPGLPELLERQGINTADIDLPRDVSGLTLTGRDIGTFVVVNSAHAEVRRRFSYAHEYCHALVDRKRNGLVSRTGDRDDLLEIRSNVFAAEFLMPGDAVKDFLGHLPEGQAAVFDGKDVIDIRHRSRPAREISMYDVIRLARYFGVSHETVLYRLKNLKLLNQDKFQTLWDQEKTGYGKKLENLMPGTNNMVCESATPYQTGRDRRVPGTGFIPRLMALGMEALNQRLISRGKLIEIARQAHIHDEDILPILDEAGLNPGPDGPMEPGE